MLNLKKPIFVTGIGTGVGKTVFSSILCSILDADYWKPVQAGDLNNTDSHFVGSYSRLTKGIVHNEQFSLKYALAPQKAAELEGVSLNVSNFHMPNTSNNLVIEGAGGCMVPLNDEETFCDLIQHLDAQVIVVTKNYLGSINHTLLTLAYLKSLPINLVGLVVSGSPNKSSELAYETHGKVPIIGHVDWATKLNRAFITQEADKLAPKLIDHLAVHDQLGR